ncbi:MAG: HAMP domain-containing protein [Desulfobacteraceae bacterium]|nr:HAMP domain-containing protein [Desulfobacteraceae bacterium]
MELENPIKSKFHYYHLANDVIVGNLIANIIGYSLAEFFISHRTRGVSESIMNFFGDVDTIYSIFCTILALFIIVSYEIPIRKCLKSMYKGEEPDPRTLLLAKKRLLNEPFLIVAINLILWSLAGLLFWMLGSPIAFSIVIPSGLITVVLAFFWVEHVTQNNLIPLFFPNGNLSSVKGARTASLRMRLGVLIFAVSIVPLAFIHLTMHRFQEMQIQGEMTTLEILNLLQETISKESIIFIAMAIGLSYLVAQNLKKPVEEIIRVLGQVARGNFAAKAKVYTKDEIGFAGETLNAMAEGLKEREFIRRTFGRYVGDKVRDEILKGEIPLDGEFKQATILFADLRNFTPLVESTPPRELVHMLNSYLNEMTKCIRGNGGLILQFIGDEIEAVFGAPVSMPNHEKAALNAALDMRQQLGELNNRLVEQGYSALSHGIGIHTGQVLAANIGTRQRTAYSLIGDTVNTASRIQDLNKEFKTDVLVSDRVCKRTKEWFEFTRMPEVKMKGKNLLVTVYSLENGSNTQNP